MMAWGYFLLFKKLNVLACLVTDYNICTKFHLHILSGFWDSPCLNWTATTILKRIFSINQLPIIRFKPFLGYMLFVTIRISLMCQKWDIIETESETWKSQMYGHNAGQPVSSLYTVLSDTKLLFASYTDTCHSIIMYYLGLFVVVYSKQWCLQTNKYDQSLQVTNIYILTKFHHYII